MRIARRRGNISRSESESTNIIVGGANEVACLVNTSHLHLGDFRSQCLCSGPENWADRSEFPTSIHRFKFHNSQSDGY